MRCNLLPCLALVFLSLLGITGCGSETVLDLSIDASAVKQGFDRVEIQVSGAEEPLSITETATNAFKSGKVYELVTDPLELKAKTMVYVRASLYSGDQEIAGLTKSVAIKSNQGDVTMSFALQDFISPNGCVLTRSARDVELPAGTNVDTFDVVAVDPSNYMLVYVDRANSSGDLRLVRLNSNGQPLTSPFIINNPDSSSTSKFKGFSSKPSLIQLNRPAGFLLMYEYLASSSAFSTTARRFILTKLTPDGTTTGSFFLMGGNVTDPSPSAAASSSSEGLAAIAWSDYFEFRNRTLVSIPLFTGSEGDLTSSGAKLELASESGSQISIAGFPSGFGVVWSEGAVDNKRLMFAKLKPSLLGVPSMPVAVLNSEKVALRPSTVGGDALNASIVHTQTSDDGGFLVAWEDTRSGASEIYTALLTSTDVIQGDSGKIAGAGFTADAHEPRLAWASGSNGGLAFTQRRNPELGGAQVFLTRLNVTGALIGVGDIQVSTSLDFDAVHPRILSLGTNSFAVFWEEVKEGSSSKLKMAQLTCD